MVVDGHAAAQSTSRILHINGYTVLTAQSAEQALSTLRLEPQIELVTAALKLPCGESGAALIGKIRLSYRSTAVMLIVPPGKQSPDPAVSVLIAPYSDSSLVQRVSDLLAESRDGRTKLASTFERHRIAREDVYAAGASLSDTIRKSRRQRAERFCSGLRTPGAKRPVVLVVDDDFVLRYAICRFLTQQGFQVLAAASAEEALQVSRSNSDHIDLLLTDFRMPGLTGRELMETLAWERPQTRSLLMSGDDLLMTGPALRKPFEMEDLLIEIGTVLVRSISR